MLAAIKETPDGALRVTRPRELAAYAERRPGFAYAVLSERGVVPGSSAELARQVAGPGVARPVAGELKLLDGRLAKVESVDGPNGRLVVVTTGNRFLQEDAPAFLVGYLPQFLMMFGPAMLGAALVTPLVVGRTLRPIRRAAQAATGIDVASPSWRLSAGDMPSEIAPFAAAIDRLLHRLQDGVARQRQFAANAAHELRTPVAILAARVDALPAGEAKTSLGRDVQRLAILVDQLLAAARLQSQGPMRAETVDLSALARTVVADLAPLALRAGRSVALEAPGPPPIRVRGESEALRSAIANLVDNAIRVEPAGGAVVLRLSQGDDAAVVEVVDHGPGVAEGDREHVFEPFWRKGGRGTGLGLSIVRQIAEACGGEVTQAPTPGGGATFRLTLPRMEGG